MPDRVVVDASVLVSAAIVSEPAHNASLTLLRKCQGSGVYLAAPAIVIPEVAGAITRQTGKPYLAQQLLAALRARADFSILPVDIDLCDVAASIASLQGIRGCDSVYLALARQLLAPFVTLDHEQLRRAPRDILAQTPQDALAGWSPQ
jgi:predicted nucleic acid-binding protein